MKFEHLVEVNNPDTPGGTTLTRDQLWNGLLLRAEKPEMFVLGLEQCTILERTWSCIWRELDFGNLKVRDRVTFHPKLLVNYQTEAQPGLPSAVLTMVIEEPAPQVLQVRFEYQLTEVASETASDEEACRQAAYVQADNAALCIIRELAAKGRLDAVDGIARLAA